MGKYLKRFETTSQYESFTGSSEFITPNVSTTDDNNEVHYTPIHNYGKDYLTFKVQENGTFKFSGTTTANTLSYSLDNGETWVALANNTDTPTISSGSSIMWKGTGITISEFKGIGKFASTGQYEVEGNIMSLTHGDNFATATTVQNHEFYWLFRYSTGLTSAENLVLPATTLASHCYSYMFQGCTSLTTAPELPATTLTGYCYDGMFYGCTSLTTAPELPATTLASTCYDAMFYNCTSLTTAPELPATTLVQNCYEAMFTNCTSLSYIKCLATNISATDCTYFWVQGVSASGTFVKNASMTGWTTGVNGIPTGWTVQDAS